MCPLKDGEGDTVKQLIADICRRSGNAYCFNLRRAMKGRNIKDPECSQFEMISKFI